MVDVIIILFCISLVLFIISGCMYVRNLEKKRWNHGYCTECGLKWIHFDTDSQGGRMYRCDNWHGCDISYSVDKYE